MPSKFCYKNSLKCSDVFYHVQLFDPYFFFSNYCLITLLLSYLIFDIIKLHICNHLAYLQDQRKVAYNAV